MKKSVLIVAIKSDHGGELKN